MSYSRVTLSVIVNGEQMAAACKALTDLIDELRFDPDFPDDALHSAKVTEEEL